LRLPTEIAAFVSNEDKMYAYVQHELDLGKPFPKFKSGSGDENSSETRTIHVAQQNITVKRGDNLG
jgi:membrane-bound lytic murein transglycosylase D